MIKIEEQEVHYCDKCEKDALYGCVGCAKDTCMECRDETFKGLFQDFSLDPNLILPVCNECYANPPEEIKERLEKTIEIDEMVRKELERRQRVSDKINKLSKKYFPPEKSVSKK